MTNRKNATIRVSSCEDWDWAWLCLRSYPFPAVAAASNNLIHGPT
jgi:hypothetical protein